MRITRLAPSPTGALHLGNARTFLVNWLLARKLGWRIVMRIEDIDSPRTKRGADLAALEDLRWLGIDFDGPITYQTHRLDVYREAARRLVESGDAYPCICTRKEVEQAASAPHAEDGAAVYPGTCRSRFASVDEARQLGREPALRFRVPDLDVEIDDAFAGRQVFAVARQLGDFVIAKADGTSAYQLAVVVDDAEAAVTDVVRGDDLLDSAPRQMLIYQALRIQERIPRYWHLPLVVGADGRRLAKRHGDTRLGFYREQGVSASRVLQLLARWSGMDDAPVNSAGDLLDRFDISRIPRQRIVFTPQDDQWLRGNRVG